jgi:hypothetical protein
VGNASITTAQNTAGKPGAKETLPEKLRAKGKP